ncbi:MAG: hypothetical protein ABL974_19075, partial [Prosthecobacter sp.]
SALVTVVYKVLGSVFPTWGTEKYVALIIALIVGLLIYLQSAPTGTTLREKIVGFLFAVLNSFTLAAAALGIDSATK